MNTPESLLRDMLVYIGDIENFVAEGQTAFKQNRMAQFAVIRAYEVIGEIAKRLPQAMLDSFPECEWQDVKAFHDFLAHNYERIRLDIVWGAVERIPMLRSCVKRMLQTL